MNGATLKKAIPPPSDPQPFPTMSAHQFDLLLGEIRKNRTAIHQLDTRTGNVETAVLASGGRIAHIERAVTALQKRDEDHDGGLRDVRNAVDTGKQDIERAKKLAEQNAEEIKAAHRRGAAQGVLATAGPAVYGIVKLVQLLADLFV